MRVRAPLRQVFTLAALLLFVVTYSTMAAPPAPHDTTAGQEFSLYLPLVFVPCPPPSLSPIANADGNGTYTVIWSLAACGPPHDKWELQYDDNPSLNTPVVIPISDPNKTTYQFHTTTPGTYYWRVRAFRPGQGWSAWSNVQSVTVLRAEVYVENDTGGGLTVEIVGVEKKRFATGGRHYWRDVAPGTYTVKAWACGTSGQWTWTLDPGENVLEFYCG